MLIAVHVSTNAREANVVRIGENIFEVKVDERAVEGRANKRLVEILAKHFKVPKSRIRLVSGARSRDKVLEIVIRWRPLTRLHGQSTSMRSSSGR